MSKIKNCKECLCFSKQRKCKICKKTITDWKKEFDLQWDHYLYLHKTWLKLKRLNMTSTGDIFVDQQLYDLFGPWKTSLLHFILMSEFLTLLIFNIERNENSNIPFKLEYKIGRGLNEKELKKEMSERNLEYTYKENLLTIIY